MTRIPARVCEIKSQWKRDRSRFAVLAAANRIWFKESNGNLQCKLGAPGTRWTSHTHTTLFRSFFCLLSNLFDLFFSLPLVVSFSLFFLTASNNTYVRLFRYADAPFPATDHSALYASLYGRRNLSLASLQF